MVTDFDLTGLAAVILAASLCGVAMTRLRQPAIVGYVVAGVILGPSGLGAMRDRGSIELLAELGVLLLLFVVGMELRVATFRNAWRVTVLATGCSIVASVAATMLLGRLFGWPWGMAVLIGFALSISSTAVVVKLLEQMNIVESPVGQLVMRLAIAQDIAFVPMMLVTRHIAGGGFGIVESFRLVAGVGVLAAIVWAMSRIQDPGGADTRPFALPFAGALERSRDLVPLVGLVACFSGAALSGLFGLTAAYGAFLAGLIIGNSADGDKIRAGIKPIENVLMMVFFLSIGLLIDLRFIATHLGTVLLILTVVVFYKTAINIAILRFLREPWPHAFIAGVLVAQMGELSFVLGEAGVSVNLISHDDAQLLVAVTALSLMITPLWLLAARRLLRLVVISVTSSRDALRILFQRDGIRNPDNLAALLGEGWGAIRGMFRGNRNG